MTNENQFKSQYWPPKIFESVAPTLSKTPLDFDLVILTTPGLSLRIMRDQKIWALFWRDCLRICLILVTSPTPLVNQGGACRQLWKGVLGDDGFEPESSDAGKRHKSMKGQKKSGHSSVDSLDSSVWNFQAFLIFFHFFLIS